MTAPYWTRLTPEPTLDEINDFFSLVPRTRPRRRILPGPKFRGRCFDPNTGKPMEPVFEDVSWTLERYGKLSCVDDDLSEDIKEEILPPLIDISLLSVLSDCLEVYKNYDFEHQYDENLPTFCKRSKILDAISCSAITFIKGTAGSGKTTQVPQYILDQHARARKHCNIVVAQPLKIMAIHDAERVSQERNWGPVGRLVGYDVEFDKMTSSDTRITYMTTGVLLRRLIAKKTLREFTHIILDGVNERDQETDFAIFLIRKLFRLNSRSVKVIFMLTSFNNIYLSHYFNAQDPDIDTEIPVSHESISIDGGFRHVSDNYIEDLPSFGNIPTFEISNPEISEEAYAIAARLIVYLDKIENDDEAKQTSIKGQLDPTSSSRGSVLVFLPGLFHIQKMEKRLYNERFKRKLQIIPLHSYTTSENLSDVFAKPNPGFRKIILSTDIAISSFTVPDVKFVIDFCLKERKVWDADTHFQSLQLQWASLASGIQRANCASEVSNCKVFRLVPDYFWEYRMSEDDEYLEIERCSLERIILYVKLLDLGAPKAVLSMVPSPPDLDNIERSILLLKEIGALSTITNQKRLDGDLTFVGRVLASLPIDMRLGKLLMLGFVFGCLSNCLVIAAALSKPCFFATPYNQPMEAYKKKLFWAQGSFSDCIALLNAFRAWEHCIDTQQFRRKSDEKAWGRKNFIQIRRIHEVKYLVDELRQRLGHFNIRSDDQLHWSSENPQQCELILKIVMAGAFYPNFFEQSVIDETQSVKEMSLLDPTNTMMFTGIPRGKAPLFKDSLLEATKQCGKQKAIFYDGRKAFIQFKDSDNIDTGSVSPAMYLAGKLTEGKRKLEICQSYAEKQPEPGVFARPPVFLYEPVEDNKFSVELPNPSDHARFPARVTHLISAVSFWGNMVLPSNIARLRNIFVTIRTTTNVKLNPAELAVDDLVLAPYDDGYGVEYYRALVTNVKPSVSVFFVDYGNTSHNLRVDDLRQLPSSLVGVPFQAIKFRLRGILPLESRPKDEGRQFILNVLEKLGYVMNVKVYSVVSKVVCVDLFTKSNEYVNEILITKDYCYSTEESRVSQLSHAAWETAESKGTSSDNCSSEMLNDQWVKYDMNTRGERLLTSRGQKLRLYGPRSTFQTDFKSNINIGLFWDVKVDRNSINSVSIIQNPSSGIRTIMVASEIGNIRDDGSMLARNTTLLPNIPELLPLLCVLFAPVVEFRVDPNQTRYIGAVCGLGARQFKKRWLSLLPDHDIVVHFKTHFNNQDITDINTLRMLINIALESSEDIAEWSQTVIHNKQKLARERLIRLIQKKRDACDLMFCDDFHKWKLIDEDDLIPNQVSVSRPDPKDFYRLHDGILLNNLQA
ncbi:ATP-dependent RNA helicase TDRD9-like [Clavelina lepadiformis]|uniref:ATP-dependent RNA helicase TDRD9-like n=1 Tax=Clavelina lepadiformis TaxID=159417 RepID=UPI0040419410